MRYLVVGNHPIATKKGIAMPGEELSQSDLSDGVVLPALVEGGHLLKVATPARKKSAE